MDNNANNATNQDAAADTSLLEKTKKYLEDKGSMARPNLTPASTPKKNISVKGVTNLIDALLIKEVINVEQYNSIKFESVNSNKPIEELVKAHTILSTDGIARMYAEMWGIGFADLKNISIDLDTLHKLPANLAKDNLAIVFEELPAKFNIAMKDPLDLQKVKYLESVLGKRVEAYFATEDDINNVIDTKYGAQIDKEVGEALEQVGEVVLNASEQLAGDFSSDNAPIIKIVDMILDYGIKHKASDIHIEPRENKIGVRFRIRGILTEKLSAIDRKLLAPVVTRIKILSNLKIDEHRIPQDGRFPVRKGNVLVDIRVSIMPGVYGEKIVLRLQEKSQGIMDLEKIGLRGFSLEVLKKAISRTQGIMLVTGPTGSGKTQTLASCLKILNTSEVNIVTLEDPVEIRMDGINQVQVNAEVGLTFAMGLRSFLRQDPDVIMVGEIRDSETANLAIQSALVGRLVLSTVHTNSAAGAFIRLIDMGIEPFLLTSTVNVVIGQRLVRVLCECKEAFKPSVDVLAKVHEELDHLGVINIYDDNKNLIAHFDKDTKDVTLYKAVGCPKCNDTGYISRTGIFEALKMTEAIGKAVVEKQSISHIQEIALKEGLITMAQDGFIKVLEGITTIEEVLRVKNE